MRKRRKVYLSSKSSLKGVYKNKLIKRYNIEYIEDITRADYVFVPIENDLTSEQNLDIDFAIYNKIKYTSIKAKKIIDDEFNFLDEVFEKEYLQTEKNKLNDELEFGME